MHPLGTGGSLISIGTQLEEKLTNKWFRNFFHPVPFYRARLYFILSINANKRGDYLIIKVKKFTIEMEVIIADFI